MDDNPPITPENPENLEQVQEKGSVVADAEAKQPTKRGRPAGSKDKEPQKRKVKIVEEAIAETPDPKTEPPEVKVDKLKPSQPSPENEPLPPPKPISPRQMYENAQQLILQLHSAKQQARRSTLADLYAKKLVFMT
jgi:hypothetical protein